MRIFKVAAKVSRIVLLKFRLWCWAINSRIHNTITISTKQGIFTVALGKDEPIGKALYSKRQFELGLMSSTMAFLRSMKMCPPKGQGTIIDIGANNGVISVGMLYAGELEKAIAIEPEPRNFSLLQRNVKQNGFSDKVICLPRAVSNYNGEVLFELSDNNFGDHRVRTDSQVNDSNEKYNESKRRTVKVKCDRLDDLLAGLSDDSLLQNIAIVWIDIQGYEGYAFMGARNLLSKGVPVMAEIWPYGIRRAGMSQEQFCDIAKELWSNYWVMRRGRFIRYPIDTLSILFEELGYDGDYGNAIFTQ